MTRSVFAGREPRLSLPVAGPKGQNQKIVFVLDSGFTGSLTLPASVIASLGLMWIGFAHALLANGSVEQFDVYRSVVDWDGRPRIVEIESVETKPLLGMELLDGHSVYMEVVPGGRVDVERLP